MGFSFKDLKTSQAAATPTPKSPFIMHPLNVPVTLSMRNGEFVFPEHFDEYQYVRPVLEMVPREITPGVVRRPALVAQLERTYKVDDVTIQEQMTASLADIVAYHSKMLRDGKIAQAQKAALLADRVANGDSHHA